MSKEFLTASMLVLRDAFTQAYEGVRVLREARLVQPCLAVIYSTIDAAAWLTADHDGDVTRDDFIAWVERYLLPQSKLTCSAIDLYAARCGVLHSMSAYSRLQRRGNARLICYVWGAPGTASLQATLDSAGIEPAIAVHLDDLANALFQGWRRCLESLESDRPASSRLAERASYLFAAHGPFPANSGSDVTRAPNG